jgi:hypothetical protein
MAEIREALTASSAAACVIRYLSTRSETLDSSMACRVPVGVGRAGGIALLHLSYSCACRLDRPASSRHTAIRELIISAFTKAALIAIASRSIANVAHALASILRWRVRLVIVAIVPSSKRRWRRKGWSPNQALRVSLRHFSRATTSSGARSLPL